MSALTKILIVLQLVFSLVCAVLLVLFISKSENYKDTVNSLNTKFVALGSQYAASQQKLTAVEAQNSDGQKQLVDARSQATKAEADGAKAAQMAAQEKTQMQQSIDELKANNALLTVTNTTLVASSDAREKELATYRDQMPAMEKKNNELIRGIQEVNNQLMAAENSIKRYQEMLANGANKNGTASVQTLSPQVGTLDATPASGKVNSQVTDVALAAGRTHIEMPLGSRDGITVGTRMYVYRGDGYVGDATVETVTPEQSVAVVISTKAGETVQKGDFVSTTGQ